MDTIEGVSLTPLRIISHPKGNIKHGLKQSEMDFNGFGEAYFSQILPHQIKGWKKHTRMTLNLIVPVGEIRFVVFSETENQFFDVTLGDKNYQRLSIKPNLWVAFQGTGKDLNLLLNLASLEHDPDEAENIDLDQIPFVWTN